MAGKWPKTESPEIFPAIRTFDIRFLSFYNGYAKSYKGESMIVKRGDLFYADLSPVVGSEQGGVRPVVIMQNDVGNKYSPTTIVAAITSQLNKAKLPTHVGVSAEEFGLPKNSVVLLEQIRTIDKKRLSDKIGCFKEETMHNIEKAARVSLGLK